MHSESSLKNLGKLYAFFLYFSLPYQVAIYSAGMSNTTGIREAILRSSLWLIPVLLLPRYTKKIAAFIGVLLWSTSIVSWSYFYVFGQDFSQSVLFIIFESNPAESREFIESYISIEIVALLTLYALVALFLWKRLEAVHLPRLNKTITVSIVTIIMAWPFANQLVQGASWDHSVAKLENRFEPVAPWNIIAGYSKYKRVLITMQERLAQNSEIPPLEAFKDTNINEQPTMVLVIGESTNANRMSLYGYPRKTTPLLDGIRDELVVFNDVISPRPYTIEALEQILSFGDQQNPDEYLTRPTLMNMMKQADYKSYWITNQQTQTKRNTMLLTFSQQMDEQVYLNNNRVQNSNQFDEAVLKPFEEVLDDKAPRKFIIVHLLGTHRAYHYRYPETFKKFDTRQHVPAWVPDEDLDEYNSYDDAVLYNDYVVSNLIRILKKKTKNSTLVYFSDHGEEVYDSAGHLFTGRNEASPTPAMYTVPFITWFSPSWKSHSDVQPLKSYEDRPYLNSDFIYSWADLADVTFKSNDLTRSIFSPTFKPRVRLIGNPAEPKSLINFDKAFPKKLQTVQQQPKG